MATPYAERESVLLVAVSRDLVALIARLLLAAMFLMTGIRQAIDFGDTVSLIAAHELPLPALAAAIGIAVDLTGGLLVLVGWKARWAALLVAFFTLVTGLLFHQYWTDADAAVRLDDFFNFWKNITIAGGFLMVFAFGPGRYSVDRS